jgi:MFS family permease
VRVIWNEPNYRIFIFFLALLAVALTGMSFIIPAAAHVVGASAAQQGRFSVVFIAAGAVCGWLPGLVADRFGYRLTAVLAAVMVAFAFLICLVTRTIAWWYAAYALLATVCYAQTMILCNMGAEICPSIPPNRLMAFSNSLMLVLVVGASALCGSAVDFSGSYTPIFVANLVLAAIASLGFAVIAREPRSGRLYAIKPIERA